MELNFFSYVNLVRLVLPSMISRKSGQIVVMSSLAGKMGVPIQTTYSASKFALQGYFDGLRGEVAHHGVGVSIVCPGPVESEIVDKAVRVEGDVQQSEGKKMPTARCTSLVAKGMYHKLAEMWISEQPFLSIAYLAGFAPYLTRLLAARIGPSRAKILKQGGDVYDLKANLGLSK